MQFTFSGCFCSSLWHTTVPKSQEQTEGLMILQQDMKPKKNSLKTSLGGKKKIIFLLAELRNEPSTSPSANDCSAAETQEKARWKQDKYHDLQSEAMVLTLQLSSDDHSSKQTTSRPQKNPRPFPSRTYGFLTSHIMMHWKFKTSTWPLNTISRVSTYIKCTQLTIINRKSSLRKQRCCLLCLKLPAYNPYWKGVT